MIKKVRFLLIFIFCGFCFHSSLIYAQSSGGLAPLKQNDKTSSIEAAKPLDLSSKFNSSRQSQAIDVLGQKINFTNPEGYCTLGSSKREIELIENTKKY